MASHTGRRITRWEEPLEGGFEYVFPAIKGIQARREYYVSMCPLRLIPKIFLFDEEELVPELRAQRTLNKNRIPEMANYMLGNRDTYVFSALTASVNAVTEFEPFANQGADQRIGLLRIPMSAVFIINDGQHRRAAIELALREQPELADESIAVVFFLDRGLKKCQQMFADLNRYAVRPSKSLGLLYDHSDEWAELSRRVVVHCDAFKGVVEMERTTLAKRSRRLFTLSAIHGATKQLLAGLNELDIEKRVQLASRFWNAVDQQIPEWKLVREGKVSSGEIRVDFIHTNGISLLALSRAGNALFLGTGIDHDWEEQLKPIEKINWSRSNTKLWEGRAMRNGRISKASDNVILTGNVIKKAIGLDLTPEERRLEQSLESRQK